MALFDKNHTDNSIFRKKSYRYCPMFHAAFSYLCLWKIRCDIQVSHTRLRLGFDMASVWLCPRPCFRAGRHAKTADCFTFVCPIPPAPPFP